MKRAGWARFAQLSAVPLALVLVLGTGGYGIARGVQSNDHRSAAECRFRTVQWMPVGNSVMLPNALPEGVRLATACYSTPGVTLFYSNEHQDKVILVTVLRTSIVHPSATTGAPIQLGKLVGYTSDEAQPDGSTFHAIFFEKGPWSYGVAASLGARANNQVTTDDLNAVALSIAQR